MEHPGKPLPGWSLGYTQEGGCPAITRIAALLEA